MITKNYILTVKHDAGKIKIRTAASSEEAAREIVQNAEGCPARAIIKCEEAGMSERARQLIEALKRANEAARIAGEANTDDGGTCNFDSVVIRLPRWKPDEFKAVENHTGTSISEYPLSGYFQGYRFLRTTTAGQGMLRTRMMEAALNSLKSETPALDVRGYYQAD